MNYEYVIRRVFKCGRYGVSGANADIFRSLERSYVINRDNSNLDKSEDFLFRYAFSCGEVSTYLKTAIEKFAKDYEEKFSGEENEEVENLISLLNNARMEQIDEVIYRVGILMKTYGLFPG